MHACAHTMCIRTQNMHACASTTYMHACARARANAPSHDTHALVYTHVHISCCALTDGAILLNCELCLGRPYLSVAVWLCLYCTHMVMSLVATLVAEAEWPCLRLSLGMVAELEVSCWACHVMHKVVALTSSLRQSLTCWRISAVLSVCLELLLLSCLAFAVLCCGFVTSLCPGLLVAWC